MRMHKSITPERVVEAIEDAMTSLDNPGFCIACGEDASGVEPDAREYECEYCGKMMVYGAEGLLLELGCAVFQPAGSKRFDGRRS